MIIHSFKDYFQIKRIFNQKMVKSLKLVVMMKQSTLPIKIKNNFALVYRLMNYLGDFMINYMIEQELILI
jgi:hypothetical protein